MFKYLDNDAPIKRESKPHTFVQFGLCSCENVDDDELFAEVVIKDGTAPRRVHLRCGMWRLDEAVVKNVRKIVNDAIDNNLTFRELDELIK